MKPTEDKNNSIAGSESRRNKAESAATCGLLLVLVAMMLPFFGHHIGVPLSWAKWVYAAGAILYTAARAVNSRVEGESLRLKRLRRMEFWAGMCFIVGGAFWFYQEQHFSGIPVGPLAILRQTVAFTMAGAVIQIVASWMISYRQKQELRKN